MCGIAGILSQNQDAATRARVDAMCALMMHRGPDDAGLWQDQIATLGHRRLSIIDLASGHQPMTSPDQSHVLVFNGEIYNFRELRQSLTSRGYGFRTQSDSEVILALYEQEGVKCVDSLRGMFAFALWDVKLRRLFCARDRFGQKPFFYAARNGKFAFSSELEPLLVSGLVEKQIDQKALYYYFRYGYIPQPMTIYVGACKLPPAHYLIWDAKGVSVSRYWQLPEAIQVISRPESEIREQAHALLKEAVTSQQVSDVPVGSFLSGGLDSSVITQLMTSTGSGKVQTFSAGFEEANYDELDYAREVADYLGTGHHEFRIKPDAVDVLPKLARGFGEPFADSSCLPTYYVAKAAAGQIKVALSGDGADELFLGYDRYRATAYSQKLFGFTRFLPQSAWQSLVRLIPSGNDQREPVVRLKRFLQELTLPLEKRYLNWMELFPVDKMTAMLDSEISQHATADLFHTFLSDHMPWNSKLNVSGLDIESYLPGDVLTKVDIASMANSLEVRNPFLDHKLAEFIWTLPMQMKAKGGRAKSILKDIFREKLPARTIARQKTGFGVPVRQWLAGDLKEFVADRLFSGSAGVRGVADQEKIKQYWQEHVRGVANHEKILWPLLMYELWHEQIHKRTENLKTYAN